MFDLSSIDKPLETEILPELTTELEQIHAVVTLEDSAAKKVRVRGLGKEVLSEATDVVMAYISRVLLAHQGRASHAAATAAAAAAGTVQYPAEWTDTSKDTVTLVSVDNYTTEYANVKAIFCKDFVATIERVERVQNHKFYERYDQLRKRMARENGGIANERLDLKHGSRGTDPNVICENGFDFRYSEEGMFGRGSYFSPYSRYSDDYRYPRRSVGSSQMFIAHVVLGKVERRRADRSIRLPSAGYHSIEGMVTERDEGHIVYDLAQAYPAYLVTYSVPWRSSFLH